MQKYCLSCGYASEMPGYPHVAHGKSQIVWTDGISSVIDVVKCYGPFAECPPPDELDLDGWEWVFGLPEPSEEELLLMDMNGEVLEADFIGE